MIGEPGLAAVRLVLYHFDDLDPTRSPSSAVLNDFTVAVPATEAWQDLVVDLPSDAFAPVDGLTPNAALLYVLLHPPASRTTVLRVDDLGLVEWRWAADEPYRAGAYDLLRNTISDDPVAIDSITWAP
jgi:hypothetical protein